MLRQKNTFFGKTYSGLSGFPFALNRQGQIPPARKDVLLVTLTLSVTRQH